MRAFILLLLLFVAINPFLYAPLVFAGSAILAWDPPTTNEDGTPLTDLAGYKVYFGRSSGNYSQNIDVGNVTTYEVDNLTNGLIYYFAVTAYNISNTESRYSEEVTKKVLPGSANTLTISKTGTGKGIVTSSPGGINCGIDCSEGYSAGSLVTLSASPDVSSTFAGWSGVCSGTGICTITIRGNTSVIAAFTAIQTGIPKISVSPSSASFGPVGVGSTSPAKTIKLRNRGKSDLIINGISIAGTNAVEFSQANSCTIIPLGGSCDIIVTFSPTYPFGKKSAALGITSNDPKNSVVNVRLNGKGI